MPNLRAIWWVGGQCHYMLYPRKGPQYPTVEESGFTPGLVWMGMKSRKCTASTMVSTLDCPDCSKVLYWLRYPGPHPDGL